jgi:hypothetical protein
MQAQQAAAEEDSDDEDGADRTEVIGSSNVGGHEVPHRHKKEEMSPAPMTQLTQVMDLGDPSDEEEDDDDDE